MRPARRCGHGLRSIRPRRPRSMHKLGLRPLHPDAAACRSPAANSGAAAGSRRRSKAPTEAQLRMASNLSMRPNDAAEISDMFFAASASERALILHNLADTPLQASARIPAARATRAIEILEMAAFAADVENFTLETRRGPDPAGAGRSTGGQRSRRRAAGLRGAGAGHAERRVPARADVPQSGIRLVREQRLPAVAAVRPPRANDPR